MHFLELADSLAASSSRALSQPRIVPPRASRTAHSGGSSPSSSRLGGEGDGSQKFVLSLPPLAPFTLPK